MWRTGSYTKLGPGAIPDTPPAAPDVSTSALRLARTQGWEIKLAAGKPQVFRGDREKKNCLETEIKHLFVE